MSPRTPNAFATKQHAYPIPASATPVQGRRYAESESSFSTSSGHQLPPYQSPSPAPSYGTSISASKSKANNNNGGGYYPSQKVPVAVPVYYARGGTPPSYTPSPSSSPFGSKQEPSLITGVYSPTNAPYMGPKDLPFDATPSPALMPSATTTQPQPHDSASASTSTSTSSPTRSLTSSSHSRSRVHFDTQQPLLLLRALTQPNPSIDFSKPLHALNLPRIPATQPASEVIYIAFEGHIFPGVVFRVDTAERGRDEIREREEEESGDVGIASGSGSGGTGSEAGTEFEFESEPGTRSQSRAASDSGEAHPESRSHDEGGSMIESESGVGEGQSSLSPPSALSPPPHSSQPQSDRRRESTPISLHHLALFIQQTIHAPLPASAQRILQEHHPHLRLRHSPSPPLHSPLRSSHSRSPPSHSSQTGRRNRGLRIIDVLGPRTKFGGLVPMNPPWRGKQVFVVRLIAT